MRLHWQKDCAVDGHTPTWAFSARGTTGTRVERWMGRCEVRQGLVKGDIRTNKLTTKARRKTFISVGEYPKNTLNRTGIKFYPD